MLRTCVPNSFVTSLKVVPNIAQLLSYKGFDCTSMGPYQDECSSCRVGYYGNSLLRRCVSCPKDSDVCDVCICSGEGFIDCSESNLKAMPSNIPRDVLFLNMDFNNITCVPVYFMEQFSQLHSL
ncbi:hypothetical protein HOLleu_15245 [Holothuria leucospilota]|uniref:Uncharacterized protein n=1 Tax=Holothuria leucospilota TaxID=206669 RepID=A0A9Q1C8W2_HOLLE|nr:hypothetical protein HOLleu_15245 [Holothuria leucospilota]